MAARGLLRPTPSLQELRQIAQPLFMLGHGPSSGATELGWWIHWNKFYWAAELRIADPAAGPTPRGAMSQGIDAFRYCLGVRWLVTGRNRLCL
jgi:hypothetical protein